MLEKVAVGMTADPKEKRSSKEASTKFSTLHVITRDEATQTLTTNEHFKKPRSCWVCKDDQHWPSKCPVFRKMNVSKRKQLAREKGACFECLGQGHLIRTCVVLWSPLSCSKLGGQGSSLGRTSTHGLKIIEQKGLPLH